MTLTPGVLDDQTVLLTGGTGSFGRYCIREILTHYRPRRIIVFSRDELKQYEMAQHVFPRPAAPIQYLLGDVRDLERLKMACRGVDVIIHAAALKQVPAAEYNPDEVVKTNILGAQNVINAATYQGVKKVIALSTDKAANPINLYGATKLVSDSLFVAANQGVLAGAAGPRFGVVRYGNVVGSRGSVLPFFQQLIRDGAASLPVTDARMTRFWLPLSQAVTFVFKSLERLQGGELFVPKIPSIRILDLIESLSPGMPHHVIGLRPGEKLHECLCPKELSSRTVAFPDHYIIQPAIPELQAFFGNYLLNPLGEEGHFVDEEFEYSSGTNEHFLTVDEISQLHASIEKVRVTP